MPLYTTLITYDQIINFIGNNKPTFTAGVSHRVWSYENNYKTPLLAYYIGYENNDKQESFDDYRSLIDIKLFQQINVGSRIYLKPINYQFMLKNFQRSFPFDLSYFQKTLGIELDDTTARRINSINGEIAQDFYRFRLLYNSDLITSFSWDNPYFPTEGESDNYGYSISINTDLANFTITLSKIFSARLENHHNNLITKNKIQNDPITFLVQYMTNNIDYHYCTLSDIMTAKPNLYSLKSCNFLSYYTKKKILNYYVKFQKQISQLYSEPYPPQDKPPRKKTKYDDSTPFFYDPRSEWNIEDLGLGLQQWTAREYPT